MEDFEICDTDIQRYIDKDYSNGGAVAIDYLKSKGITCDAFSECDVCEFLVDLCYDDVNIRNSFHGRRVRRDWQAWIKENKTDEIIDMILAEREAYEEDCRNV